MSTPAIVALAWVGAFAAATGFAQHWSRRPAWHIDSAVHVTSVLAVVTGLCWTLFQLVQQRPGGRERLRWTWACWSMLLLAALQATDWLVGNGVLTDDWLIDLPLWMASTLLVRRVLAQGRERRGASQLWWLAVGLQYVFIVCDLLKGRSVWMLSAHHLLSIAEWGELLTIECFVGALVVAGAGSAKAEAGWSRPALAVGAEARRLYERAHLFRKAIYPGSRLAFWPGLREAFVIVGSIGLVAVLGGAAFRASGRSRRAQLADLWTLTLRDGFDPLAYYFQELYQPGGRAEAGHYLSRCETKNGLLFVLNNLRASPHGPLEMKDKALFADCGRRAGLPVPPTLLQFSDGEVAWTVSRDQLDRDLFCKQRLGRGARGAAAFRRIAPFLWRDRQGVERGLDDLVQHLRTLSRKAPLIVQPLLRNHGELADLAEQSLVTIRVLTCLDAHHQPVVTHGLLRILSKLEPRWQRRAEYGVPIGLESGRLGSMTSDRMGDCGIRYAHHPVTGRAVEGRVLQNWPGIQALALEAHRAFAHRILIGWDIAMTDDGPVLLEGNVNLDVTFPQQAYRQAIGRSPLGPLLQHHLAVLARSENVD
ncbi:sugar-transfer associated ATP-grasp domain-containing protein [Xylophilus sp. GOD-11R]|uniref:sugar-transfer associated ATP-grasp domain-containing protein n=1 Tax=Xylophilus sp. GOD-11R TaxID=3089814 RepID=UPI00298D5D30|nr:sugar-transfer associated ATP-grasp domain-containing protein [Xylophilus sp. GOD-11R]WPB59214.1 sugar-transfer associated ATP-grasp domain-containing protein [Xylophilus sp. GOD-11R]